MYLAVMSDPGSSSSLPDVGVLSAFVDGDDGVYSKTPSPIR